MLKSASYYWTFERVRDYVVHVAPNYPEMKPFIRKSRNPELGWIVRWVDR